LTYTDTFDPRPFQADVIEAIFDGLATDRRFTVALGTPGTGKTLTYQAAATHLVRHGHIDYLAVFVPRISLAQQCELDWMRRDKDTGELYGHFKLFDAKSHFGKIRHSDARPPLTQPGAVGTGFVSTYAALATRPEEFIGWAEEHKGRFLLVADEAQFCGDENNNGGGTRAGHFIKEMHEHAAHTVLLTGTPYRSDGRKLILADYADPDEKGKERLIRHAEATYADGIDGEYLRRFEMLLHDGPVKETDVGRQWSVEYQLSSRESNLQPILRMPTTWQPMADMVVRSVREKQVLNPAYRGLISCMEKKDAETVRDYLLAKYPGLRVHIAVSADGAAAQKALQDFKTQPADILVTVRMAFIGYDCKPITVVGVLTHYRDQGHLMQLVGRGLRVWDDEPFDEQTCHIIAPDDPQMQEFLGQLREEQDEGMRRRQERTRDEDDSSRKPAEHDQLTYIESTDITKIRAVSNDAEADHDQRLLINSAKSHLGMVDDVTKLVAFAELLGQWSKASVPEDVMSVEFPQQPMPDTAQPAPPMTDKQQIEKLNSDTYEQIKAYLADRGITGGRTDYGKFIGKTTKRVNEMAGFSSDEVRTVEDAEARLRAAKTIRGRS
jgi:superfamily II DNA or RNA helicase